MFLPTEKMIEEEKSTAVSSVSFFKNNLRRKNEGKEEKRCYYLIGKNITQKSTTFLDSLPFCSNLANKEYEISRDTLERSMPKSGMVFFSQQDALAYQYRNSNTRAFGDSGCTVIFAVELEDHCKEPMPTAKMIITKDQEANYTMLERNQIADIRKVFINGVEYNNDNSSSCALV